MLTVIPITANTFDRALAQSRWLKSLGGISGHQCMIVTTRDCPPVDGAGTEDSILKNLVGAFKDVFHTQVASAAGESPDAMNILFRRAFRNIQSRAPQPFLWLLPTAIPIRTGWMPAIINELTAIPAGKAFLGCYHNHPPRMHPCAVWPARTDGLAPSTMYAGRTPFWTLAGAEIAARMIESRAIRCEEMHGPALIGDVLAEAALWDSPEHGAALLEELAARKAAGTLGAIVSTAGRDLSDEPRAERFKVPQSAAGPDRSLQRAMSAAGQGGIRDLAPEDVLRRSNLPPPPPPRIEAALVVDEPVIVRPPRDVEPAPAPAPIVPADNPNEMGLLKMRGMVRDLWRKNGGVPGIRLLSDIVKAPRDVLKKVLGLE